MKMMMMVMIIMIMFMMIIIHCFQQGPQTRRKVSFCGKFWLLRAFPVLAVVDRRSLENPRSQLPTKFKF